MKVKGNVLVYLILLIGSAVLLFVSCQGETTNKEMTKQEMIERGKFMITVGGCDDCHTPKNFGPNGPELDMSRRLSGHPAGTLVPPVDTSLIHQWAYMSHDLTTAIGPWGITFSANLTPDNKTGIGTWQAEMFVNAMKTGKHLGVAEGRPILPPMPWQNMAQLPEEDLKCIFAYLKSLPAVNNKVPDPIPPHQIAAIR
jgi:hypothetical protein